MEKLLPLYENAILNCSNGQRDFDCNVYDYNDDDDNEREIDLSDLARTEEKNGDNDDSGEQEEIIPKVAPRINIPE